MSNEISRRKFIQASACACAYLSMNDLINDLPGEQLRDYKEIIINYPGPNSAGFSAEGAGALLHSADEAGYCKLILNPIPFSFGSQWLSLSGESNTLAVGKHSINDGYPEFARSLDDIGRPLENGKFNNILAISEYITNIGGGRYILMDPNGESVANAWLGKMFIEKGPRFVAFSSRKFDESSHLVIANSDFYAANLDENVQVHGEASTVRDNRPSDEEWLNNLGTKRLNVSYLITEDVRAEANDTRPQEINIVNIDEGGKRIPEDEAKANITSEGLVRYLSTMPIANIGKINKSSDIKIVADEVGNRCHFVATNENLEDGKTAYLRFVMTNRGLANDNSGNLPAIVEPSGMMLTSNIDIKADPYDNRTAYTAYQTDKGLMFTVIVPDPIYQNLLAMYDQQLTSSSIDNSLVQIGILAGVPYVIQTEGNIIRVHGPSDHGWASQPFGFKGIIQEFRIFLGMDRRLKARALTFDGNVFRMEEASLGKYSLFGPVIYNGGFAS